jgi:hypothetical protein
MAKSIQKSRENVLQRVVRGDLVLGLSATARIFNQWTIAVHMPMRKIGIDGCPLK